MKNDALRKVSGSPSSTTSPIPTPHPILPVFLLYIYIQTDGSIERRYVYNFV